MKTDSAGLIETLRKTSRCRSEISKAAESFVELPPDRCESLLKRLIDAGEGGALGILLIICGVHGVKLDPTLLAGALKVVESLEDFSFPYIAQDLAAVDPLLQLARSRDITLEHRIFAARLAAELTVRLGGDRGPVKKVLQRMAIVPLHPGLQLMNSLSLDLLDLELEEAADFPWETQKDVMSALPEEKPPVIIGGGYTVRRPVPKIGRNAPCHCGSGRKYKKCCHDKDRKLLRDASPYEGVTMTQARSTPGLVDGGEIIHGMKAFELKKLTPSKLNEEQLLAAFQRANLFRLNEVALAMLLELKGRGRNADDTITPLLVNLLDSALHAKDLELAKRIRRHIPGEAFPDEAAIRFHMELLENREYFEGVEARCREALTSETGEETFKLDPLLVLGYDCENLFPALSVVFSRAAIVGNPEREFENEFLLEVIRGARADLDLEPWSDPVEEYVQWSRERNEEDSEREVVSREIEALREKTARANRQAAEKTKRLRKKERELAGLLKKIDAAETAPPDPAAPPGPAREMSEDERGAVNELRRRISGLKSEIRAQQQSRRQLREQLREERERTRVLEKDKKREEASLAPADAPPLERAAGKIVIPEFTDPFRRACESMPAPVAAKALRAAAGFSANDESVWRRTKRIDKVPHLFRIKIDRRHRLMIHSEKNIRIQVLDLIHREHLTTWIKRRRA